LEDQQKDMEVEKMKSKLREKFETSIQISGDGVVVMDNSTFTG